MSSSCPSFTGRWDVLASVKLCAIYFYIFCLEIPFLLLFFRLFIYPFQKIQLQKCLFLQHHPLNTCFCLIVLFFFLMTLSFESHRAMYEDALQYRSVWEEVL